MISLASTALVTFFVAIELLRTRWQSWLERLLAVCLVGFVGGFCLIRSVLGIVKALQQP